MATLFWAIGLVLVIEGLAWALAPRAIEQMLAAIREMPVEARRLLGLSALAVGVLFLWVASYLGG